MARVMSAVLGERAQPVDDGATSTAEAGAAGG
jgi:hypothetical protein